MVTVCTSGSLGSFLQILTLNSDPELNVLFCLQGNTVNNQNQQSMNSPRAPFQQNPGGAQNYQPARFVH